MRHLLTIIYLLFVSLTASAQFYVTGDDPGRLKWKSIDTDSYRIIYPSTNDSLALVYAAKLEKFKIPVSRTTGYVTGQGDGKLMPVVLHTHNGSNGSVAWAPKRMDLFTLPSAYDVDPLPWSTMLAVHESRHVTQMQFGMTNVQRPFGYVFGEMWNILVSIFYPNMYFIEGDAVVAETALTRSGRGRTADFLNYYRIAFDNGDFRNWNKWLYGSQRNYYPNHYALGYMLLANMRVKYDCPMYMHESYERASRKIWDICSFQTISKRKSGLKFNDMFMEICRDMNEQWQKEDSLRGPFMSFEAVGAEPRLYTDYSNNLVVGDDIYSVKSGYLNTPVLVRTDKDGREHFVSRFSAQTGRLQWSDYFKRIYWSESIPDARWSMKTDSKIRYIEEGKSHKRTLRGKRLLHNPAPYQGDSFMAAAEYDVDGSSSLGIVGGLDGSVIESVPAPDSLQLVETAWIGKSLYATAVSEGGFGIYSIDFSDDLKPAGDWTTVLAPQPVKVKDFDSEGEELMFTCDRTGVNELYHLDPSDGVLIQKTNTRYGASDFAYSQDGSILYFSAPTRKGLQLSKVSTDSLLNRKVRYEDIYKYELADRLAEQERAVAALRGDSEAVPFLDSISISSPKKYSKVGHMFNVHSWAPVYVSVDNIMNMSFDRIYQAASLGISGIMQNRLATGVGEFGYSAHKDPYDRTRWRHSGHVKYTYSGLYPVIETSLDINDRGSRQYFLTAYMQDGNTSISLESKEMNCPYIEGSIKMYIPFNFSSGGWFRGLVPQVSYRISNDMFNTGITLMSYDPEMGSISGNPVFVKSIDGKNRFRHSLTGSIRGYTMLGTPNSAVYPKWGIGLEVGASGSLESSDILSPMGYAYLYGYVPGVVPAQGLKLTAMHQLSLGSGTIFNQAVVNSLPRGLSENSPLLSFLSIMNGSMTKVTADYGIPIYTGDWGLFGGFFYVKRLVLTPHFDYMFAGNNQLYSAGCDLVFDLNSILWLGWPCSLGVTYSYNGGPSFNALNTLGLGLGHHYVGPVFNVTF